ncbi:MAG TPA: cupin domain-containing protein [Opitutaceae bacterium]
MKLPTRSSSLLVWLPLLAFATATSAQSPTPSPAAANAPVPAEQRPATGSKTWTWESLAFRPNAVGGRREVNNSPSATMRVFESHVTTLNPGLRSHAPHRHGQEEFIIIKEGTLEASINGRTQRAGPGSIFFFAAHDAHNSTNVGDTPATYLVFNFQTALSATAHPEGVEAATASGKLTGKLQSAVYEWDQLVATKTAKGERRQVLDSPTATLANLECHITTLNIGETPHAAHRHPDEELIIVKDGEIEATVDGVVTRGGPGSIFFFGSNSMHGMKNVGGTVATYYVFRVVTEQTPKTAAP